MCRQEIIDNFMDYMDFNRIHEVMVALDWKWAFTNGVPEVSEIRQTFRKLVNELFDEDLKDIQTGGFHIWIKDDVIRAAFEVESWEVEL